MVDYSVLIPDEERAALIKSLEALAGDNPVAKARLHSDAFRLWSGYKRGSGFTRAKKSLVDQQKGKRALKSISQHAKKLADALEMLAPNLVWEGHLAEAAAVSAIKTKADDLMNTFAPRSKKGPRQWEARYVESWAAKVFTAYTGKKASLTNNAYKDGSQVGGAYYHFKSEVFSALKIETPATSLIRARRKRERVK